MINSGKVSICHICFIHRASRYHPHFINGSMGSYYPHTTIERPWAGDKS